MTKSKNKRTNKKKRTIRGGKFRFLGSSNSQLEKDWKDEDCENKLNEKAALVKQKGILNNYLFNPRKINSCIKIANKLGKPFDARGVQASSSTSQYFEDPRNKRKIEQFVKEESSANADFRQNYDALIKDPTKNQKRVDEYVHEKFRTKYDTIYNKGKTDTFINTFKERAKEEPEYNHDSDDIWNDDQDETPVHEEETGVGLETGGKNTTKRRGKRRNKHKNKKSRKHKSKY